MKEAFKTWFARFIAEHMDRIVFASIVLGLSGVLWAVDMQDESKNIIMLVVGAFLPKIRTPK